MLLVDEVDSKEFLAKLFDAMYDELPLPKPKRKSGHISRCALPAKMDTKNLQKTK